MHHPTHLDPSGRSKRGRIMALYGRAVLQHWPIYTLGALMLLITSFTEVLTPKFIQWGLDLATHPETVSSTSVIPAGLRGADTSETLQRLALAFAASLIFAMIGRFAWRQFLARRTHVAGHDLKLEMWNVLRHLPLSIFHRYPLGDLMNRATGDWNAVRTIHGFTLVLTFDLIFFAVLAIASMLMMDATLTIYCLIIFPFLPRAIIKLARREHDQHIHAQEKLSSLSDLISQSLGTIRMQRATQTSAMWEQRLAVEANEYARRRFEVVKTGLKISPLGALPTLAAYVVLLLLGITRIRQGTLSVGEFIAFQSYVLMLQVPLFELGDCIAEWQRGFASMERLQEIFDLRRFSEHKTPQRVATTVQMTSPVLHPVVYSVRGLSYVYQGNQRPVLNQIQLSIRRGEIVGLLGPIGSGKTSLLKILAGLIEPPRGCVSLHGNDLCDVSRQWLAKNLVMVPQRSFLFAGSIRDNLQLDGQFSEPELWRVLKLVELEADVRHMPHGLDSWVGEWGINLSGGQKQRLALARALLRPRGILLLDDCLSAVDAVTEERILRALSLELRQHHDELTILWVAHRRSTLRLCQRIYSLDAGVLELIPADSTAAMLSTPGKTEFMPEFLRAAEVPEMSVTEAAPS